MSRFCHRQINTITSLLHDFIQMQDETIPLSQRVRFSENTTIHHLRFNIAPENATPALAQIIRQNKAISDLDILRGNILTVKEMQDTISEFSEESGIRIILARNFTL